MRTLVIGILAATLLAFTAAAETYKFEIADPVKVGKTDLKPGKYAVDVDGDKASLKDKKGNAIDVKAKVEQAQGTAKTTLLGLSRDSGAQKLESVRPGGTSIRVVFE